MNSSNNKSSDTIVALSTPRGYSGVGVIRMSGSGAVEILNGVFRASGGDRRDRFPDRTAVHGTVTDPATGDALDDGLAVVMKGPRSYTGEDVVELTLHGSPLVLDTIVHLLVRQGARPATKGEFTRLAFLAGKLDLVQAEAVIDLIESVTPAGAKEARSRMDLQLSTRIHEISDLMKTLLADLEAHIDFDEEDEEPAPDWNPRLEAIVARMNGLIADAAMAAIRRTGLSTVIVGRPNVGKSTLFNSLLNADRVIVTPFPGTTRDTVDERMLLGDHAFLLCDTAGLRKDPDPIERQGIERTLAKIDEAHLIVMVFDGSVAPDLDDELVMKTCEGRQVATVINKADLGTAREWKALLAGSTFASHLTISAKTGQGIRELRDLLKASGDRQVTRAGNASTGSLTRRGLLLMETSCRPLENLLSCAQSGEMITPEIVSAELRNALIPLEEITGERVDEGVLDRIFERFCVGK